MIMVATRSSRSSSSRLSKKHGPVVDRTMEDEVDKREETGDINEGVEDTIPEEKKDIGCKQCLEEEEKEPSKPIHKKTSLVRFNEVVETREVETEYDKPDRTLSYVKGFLKRVIICSVLVMFVKSFWPQLQPVVWPEAPVKVDISLSPHLTPTVLLRRGNSTSSTTRASAATSVKETTS